MAKTNRQTGRVEYTRGDIRKIMSDDVIREINEIEKHNGKKEDKLGARLTLERLLLRGKSDEEAIETIKNKFNLPDEVINDWMKGIKENMAHGIISSVLKDIEKANARAREEEER